AIPARSIWMSWESRDGVSLGTVGIPPAITFELRYMKGVHSEADTAIWLPKEHVLFSASAFVSEQVNIFRPFVNISDILAAGKMMKALNPEYVIPGHGPPTTSKLFDDGEKYYALLVERVAEKVKEG